MSLSPLEVLRLYPGHDFSLGGLLASRVSAVPERALLQFEQTSLTYAGFAAQVVRMAALLAARGVGAGDRVGVMSPNHPATAILLFALARLGAIMVPANADYRSDEARYVFGHAGVCGVVAAPATRAVAAKAIAPLAPRPWLLLNEEDAASGIESLDAALRALPADTPAPPTRGGADATCVIIYTSGTTGFPKGVMHSQRGVALTAEGFVGRMHLQPADRLLMVLPMFHINALFYSLCGAIAAGACVVLARRFSASGFWHLAAETGATEVNLMAAAARILMLRPEAEYVPGHRLRKAFIAPLTADLMDAFTRRFGVGDIIECYGMTEIPGVISNPFDGTRRLGSMGIASPHPDPAIARPEFRVLDDGGGEAAEGAPGELAVRTPTLMQGYWSDPDATGAAFRDGWFLTGDIVRREADGFLFFVARRKDMIRRRGENISGAELDRVVAEHPAVAEAAAIPVPSAFGDEDILVAVVRRPGAEIGAGEIRAWVRDRLSAFKAPRFVAFVDALPKTATQRVEKYRLRTDPELRARATDLEAEAPAAGR